MDAVFCFEDEMTGCVCGWCHMTEQEARESLGEPPAEQDSTNGVG